jgi:beta-lactamase class A
VFQLITYNRQERSYPPGLVVGGVPVGGLDRQASAARLLQVYSIPVELRYGEAVVLINPSAVDFELDLDAMLPEIERTQARQDYWEGFWDTLWGRSPAPVLAESPLQASFSERELLAYLNELALRYDRPPAPAMPVIGTTQIRPGAEGTYLDIESSLPLVAQALLSPGNRVVDLPLLHKKPSKLSLANLEIFLKQAITLSRFDGLTAVYFFDLQTGQEIHFAYQLGEDVEVKPDIAFSGASMIKIPILLSIFRRIDENPNPQTLTLLKEMIEKSGNDPADWVMEQVIDPRIGPTLVTADLQTLDLENTFLAGHFYAGAPLLVLYETPANLREDVNTDPDLYNQTTVSDMGMLLVDLYQCSQFNGGALAAIFQGEITQAECQDMITYLTHNNIAALIEAGVPDGTPVAHKHGWVSLGGIMNTLGDASIVYSPGGDYVFVVFLYQPTQLVWEPASRLVADLSRLIYGYFNPPVE